MPKRREIISKEDVKLINDTFSVQTESQVIEKNAFGEIIKPKREIVNPQGYAIRSFMGRTLKHNKSYKKTGQPQVLVAKSGMKFEDVDSLMRDKVTWRDSDFI